MFRCEVACARVGTAAVTVLLAVMSPASERTLAQSATGDGATPIVGTKARDFSLTSLDGATVRLSEEIARGPVVLVVLRGWPGYQCPFCTKQFGQYLTQAGEFEKSGARVLFVYPGPSDGLKEHAQALASSKPLPASFRLLIDPDYSFTNAYGLRWNAPKETAYPATFVLDRSGTVTFAQISRVHGDRVTAADALKALAGTR